MKIKRLINLAKAMRPIYQKTRCFHVCFLMQKNKFISIGWNVDRTHPILKKHPYGEGTNSTHAEVSAIIKGKNIKFDKCDLIVIRIDNNGNVANSKPCQGCLALIQATYIKDVWHSTKNGNIEKLHYLKK